MDIFGILKIQRKHNITLTESTNYRVVSFTLVGTIMKITKFNLMTVEDFNNLLNSPNKNYYTGRWEYFKEVIELIESIELNSALEIGPGFFPVIKNADLLLSPKEDQFGSPEKMDNKIIIHDISEKRWPIENKEYDITVALQVWEHLDNKQGRAFRELIRISKRAILSFPYLWKGGEDKHMHRIHRNIDKDIIGDWTLNVTPKKIIEIPRTGKEFSKGKRLVYYWEFD